MQETVERLAVTGRDARDVEALAAYFVVEQRLEKLQTVRDVGRDITRFSAATDAEVGTERDDLRNAGDVDLLLVEMVGRREGDHHRGFLDFPDRRLAFVGFFFADARAHRSYFVTLRDGELEPAGVRVVDL